MTSADPRPGVRPTVWLGFAALVVLIGVNFVAVRISNEGFPPLWGAALRFGIASWLLFGIVFARRIPLPVGRAFVGATVYGLLAIAAFFGLIYWGAVEVHASTSVVINATVPLLTLLMATTLGIERFRGAALAGGALVIAGVAVLVGFGGSDASPVRLLAVLAAAAAMAGSSVAIKGFPSSHPLAANAVGMGVAFLLLLAASAALDEPWGTSSSPRAWWALAFLTVSSLVLFPLYVWLVQQWTATATVYAVVLAPFVTAPVAWWLADEPMTIWFIVAAAIVMLGVYLGAIRRPRAVGKGA